jgi:hypothetical protein
MEQPECRVAMSRQLISQVCGESLAAEGTIRSQLIKEINS